ncbi:hypothetical protein tinsulaeT_16520 [Thalassotalea insulae]|uniref:Tetratricopeptide repeat protein n=1 Tax=Thalassotalea insulae TaxID=2056778 RepID=A0ABQ6GQU6_9GAMM|nr:tetratricopeptide repeat protein [Thalassotalea insulae]GLX78312.1 hypothetical protein tinsulaeT_16520 [Thalassotalea insulae]
MRIAICRKKALLLYGLLVIFLWLSNSRVLAGQTKKNPSTNPLKKITAICLHSPFDCLANVDQVLQQVPSNSRVYFEVLQYKYEALFNLQKDQQLYQETRKWINRTDLPFLFQITNAIYFAKTALAFDDIEASKQSKLFAKSLLGQMNKEYPSPIRIVQFANLLMVLEEYQPAYQLLTKLVEKHPNSPDSRFMLELHGNMGHVANYLNQPKQALMHWLETVKWAEIFGNKQQMAVVYFNLANTYVRLNKYSAANDNFNKAIITASEAGDLIKANQARYHLANVLIKQQQYCQTHAIITQIDEDNLPANYQLQNLTTNLKLCK